MVGVAALFGYAAVQTLQAEDTYGRIFAAYAGFFCVGALLWGWLVDASAPDKFDWIGAAVVSIGILIILWGRDVFA